MRGAVPTEAQRDLQERWLRQAHEAWTQRREARLDEADAQGLPPEETALLRAGAGHAAQLAAFLREAPEAMPLLRTLLPKDLLDIAPDVLRDTWRTRPGRTACRKASGRPLCSVRASDMSSFCRSGGS